jgi:hypothetical protein
MFAHCTALSKSSLPENFEALRIPLLLTPPFRFRNKHSVNFGDTNTRAGQCSKADLAESCLSMNEESTAKAQRNFSMHLRQRLLAICAVAIVQVALNYFLAFSKAIVDCSYAAVDTEPRII